MPEALKRKASKPTGLLRAQAEVKSSHRHTRSSSLASQTTLTSESLKRPSESMTKSTAFNALDQLDSIERNKQMEIIDSLRCLGVGKDVSLPQASSTISTRPTMFSIADMLRSLWLWVIRALARARCWRVLLHFHFQLRVNYARASLLKYLSDGQIRLLMMFTLFLSFLLLMQATNTSRN